MRWPLVLLIASGACSGSHAPPPTPSGPPAPMLATPAAPDDVQVATVNGRPVWGSCVIAQTARGASRDEAVKQCIDFELMAQAAEERGLQTDHEVVVATRTALVSQLVAKEYEDKFTRPADFGAFWTKSIEKNRAHFDHDEARGSVYARIELPKNAPAAAEAKAKQQIDAIYAALADERGLMKPHVEAIAKRVVGDMPQLKVAAVPADLRIGGRLDETYVNQLFTIPEVGRVAPPIRTKWGWDVILFDSVVPAIHAAPDELAAAALPEIKRGFFPYWVNRIGQSLGVHVQLVDKNLPLLENL